MSASTEGMVSEQETYPQTLEELAEQFYWHAVHVRGVLEETAQAQQLYLWRFLDWFGSPEPPPALFAVITPDAICKCLASYASGHGPGSRGNMQMAVRSFLRFAYCQEYLKADLSPLSPAIRCPHMGKVARSIPPECIDMLVSRINGDAPADVRDRAIVAVLSTYGVRGVQVRRLRMEDLDWEQNRIRFPAAKGGRPIEQHLNAKVGNRIAEYLLKARPPCSCREVFVSTGEPASPLTYSAQLSSILRRRMKQAGIELPQGVSCGSHGFRHAFASRLYGRVPFKDIVDMLGHRDPASTLIYGKVDVVALAKAALPWPGGVT
jgi:integrase/recombinase XerD